MVTKFILHIAGDTYELRADDLVNWEDVCCSYRRAEYDGVVRSFTSQFEFASKARNLLMELYLADRCAAEAVLSVHTITDQWGWEEQFRCSFDFSTIEWDDTTLRINCIDNSLAALIKANKGTKYEFIVGEDISRDGVLNFDRVPILETLTYEFTDGSSYDDSPDILVTFERGKLPWVGLVGSEISINRVIDYNDDQELETDSYVLKAMADIDVTLECEYQWRTDQDVNGVDLYVGVGSKEYPVVSMTSSKWYYNNATNPGSLPSPDTLDPNRKYNTYALINGIVWIVNPGRGVWMSTGRTITEYFSQTARKKITIPLKKNEKLQLRHVVAGALPLTKIRFMKSQMVFSWVHRGEPVSIDVISPKHLAETILRRVAEEKINVRVEISEHDTRLADTWLLAAESARGITGAVLQSSFTQYCEWMSAVFGYVYHISEPEHSPYKAIKECGTIIDGPVEIYEGSYTFYMDPVNVHYSTEHGRFLYYDADTNRYYTFWPYRPDWQTSDFHPRTDVLFRFTGLSNTRLYYFTPGCYNCHPEIYEFPEEDIGKDMQTVRFLHRSELFGNTGQLTIPLIRDPQYKIDNNVLYSSVEAGYTKKDYNSINGRDEFNFTNTYTTGCAVASKKLSLISSYRADCYGIEFAVQKRGETTTDTSSDKDVFFILCTEEKGGLIPDRAVEVENALSSGVFNAAFSPMACVRANAGIIGLQAEAMTLTFASSTANSSIRIGGEAMSADIAIDTPIATCGVIEFSTDEVYVPSMANLIAVETGGFLYKGFLMDVDVKYGRPETSKYKLIVKEVSPCS